MKIFFFIILLLLFTKISTQTVPCDHPIYCQGELLNIIQMSSIFNDSKTFVDMPLKFPPNIILEKFQNLSDHSISSLNSFLTENFLPAGSEVLSTKPVDWHPNPKFLTEINNEDLKNWGSKIHAIWLDLFRVFDHNLSCSECFSSLKSPKPFIVPGGRFREYYYWDNLWIVEGLLVSEMLETSLDIVENLLDMIEKYGFVWNGARLYYSKRSQPPVISLMIFEIYQEISKGNSSKALNLLEKSYDLLLREYNFWMKEKRCNIVNISKELMDLNCYKGFSEMPRPESYKEDQLLAEKSQKINSSIFREIIAGAETGWDFSSRFFEDFQNMTTINVSRMIPVDLNAILYKVEVTLSEISKILNRKKDELFFREQSQLRKKTMMEILFDERTSQWRDADIENLNKNPNFYLSNFIPLWAFDNIDDVQINEIIGKIDQIQKNFIGGIPTSLKNSSQQWDFPNVWPPLQDFIIFGLNKRDDKYAKKVAFELAQKYIDNAFCGWSFSEAKMGKGAMFEKYNSLIIGVSGSGGEYEAQEGFGWSNGVALKILKHFGKELRRPSCDTIKIE